MTFQFVGTIKETFDYREGVSQKDNRKWESVKVWLEENGDQLYKSSVVVEVWRPALIEWLRRNTGAVVTMEIDPRVEVYNVRPYMRCRCIGCLHNGVKIGTVEQTLPAEEAETQPQTVYAKDVSPVSSETKEVAHKVPEPSDDDLPF